MLVSRAIFLESTLSHEEVHPFLKKSDLILPSIMRGALIKLFSQHPSIKEVIIVDGVFEQYPSITHKEILWLLSRGVQVVGMGSMGALRAYELRNHGMHGYGWVYAQFLNGHVDGDDEVAVAYDPRNPANSKTLAMVNFRKTIENHEELTKYLPIIRNIHFRERTWKTLSMHLPRNALDSLSDNYIDIKKEDVLFFLKNSASSPSPAQIEFIANSYFNSMYLAHLKMSLIQFIRMRIQKIDYIELKDNSINQEECVDICRFLELPHHYTPQIVSVLNKLSGVKLNKYKIKSFTYKLQFELNLSSPQEIQGLFDKLGISIEKMHFLFENLTKLFDYFLCTA